MRLARLEQLRQVCLAVPPAAAAACNVSLKAGLDNSTTVLAALLLQLLHANCRYLVLPAVELQKRQEAPACHCRNGACRCCSLCMVPARPGLLSSKGCQGLCCLQFEGCAAVGASLTRRAVAVHSSQMGHVVPGLQTISLGSHAAWGGAAWCLGGYVPRV